jgi:hypothetical protein
MKPAKRWWNWNTVTNTLTPVRHPLLRPNRGLAGRAGLRALSLGPFRRHQSFALASFEANLLTIGS